MCRQIPYQTLKYRIIKKPYMHDKWVYHVQYWWKNRWNTTQSSVYDAHFDTNHFSLPEARQEITRLKRGHDTVVVEEQ